MVAFPSNVVARAVKCSLTGFSIEPQTLLKPSHATGQGTHLQSISAEPLKFPPRWQLVSFLRLQPSISIRPLTTTAAMADLLKNVFGGGKPAQPAAKPKDNGKRHLTSFQAVPSNVQSNDAPSPDLRGES